MESCINATDEIVKKISNIQTKLKCDTPRHYLGVIYKLISPNKDVYVGKTVSLGFRFYCHKKYHNGGSKLNKSIKKYGWDKFEKKILYTTHIKENVVVELNKKEIYYIALFDSFCNGFNMTRGGDGGGFINHKHSDETKKKMSLRKCSENTRKLLSLSSTGREFSEETRKKISIAHKGRKFSDEAKKRMSLGHIGRKHSLETRNKISIGNSNRSDEIKKKMSEVQKLAWVKRKAMGWKHSEETKKKIREKIIGRKASDETRRKISERQTGRKHSEQARINNGLAQKRAWARRKGILVEPT